MNRVENFPPVLTRHQGLRNSSGDIAEQGGVVQLDVPQYQGGDGRAGGKDVWASRLGLGYHLQVHRREKGCHDGPREMIGDQVLLTLDMANVRGELGDVGQVPLLPRCPGRGCRHDQCEGLVVRELSLIHI